MSTLCYSVSVKDMMVMESYNHTLHVVNKFEKLYLNLNEELQQDLHRHLNSSGKHEILGLLEKTRSALEGILSEILTNKHIFDYLSSIEETRSTIERVTSKAINYLLSNNLSKLKHDDMLDLLMLNSRKKVYFP